jgi:Protein of unknown function (DUF2867)
MKLPESAHTSQPWRIHEIAPDFRLEDVWALPTPGGPDDFPQLVALMEAFDPAKSTPAPVRALFALRWKLGEVLGWESPKAGLGTRVPTLRDRLPADLRETTAATAAAESHFRGLYRTENETALEIANQTVHAILHLGWVPDGGGGGGVYRGQMAVLVKPNGLFGQAYMAAITPFRYLLVYPAMLRELGREWPAASRHIRATV